MAILTKAQLQADNSASFADNNTQAITPAILRTYNGNIIDTLVDSLVTGSFAQTAVSNDFTAANSFTSISASSFVSASAFVGDGSKLTNITASTALPISEEGVLLGYATQLNFSGSNISASLAAGIATISVTTNNLVTTSSFNSFTASVNGFTASQETKDTTLQTYTASVNTKFTTVGVSTASLNTFTSSQETKNTTLATYTASVNNSISLLNTYTASNDTSITNLNSFTSSQNTKNTTLASYTGSNDTKWSNLGTQSGSWVTETESGSFLITASVSLNTITFTKGNNTTFAVTVNTGSATSTDITSLNSFTASQDTKNIAVQSSTSSLNSFTASNANTSLNTYTASQDTKNTTLASVTSSLNTATASLFTSTSLSLTTASVSLNTITFRKGDGTTFAITVNTGSATSTDISALNSFTSSQLTINSAIQASTSSLNTFSASTLTRLTNIESTTASLNSSVAALNTFTASQSTASLVTSITNLNSFTSSQLTINTAIGASTSSLNTATASLFTSASLSLTTASVLVNVITFRKGDGTTFDIAVAASGSVTPGTISGSAQITALGFVSSSVTASSLVTASVSLNTITFTKGDASTFNITVNTGSATSTDITALNSFTASQETKNTTLASVTSSLNTATASLFTSASLALTTASFSGNTLTFTKGDASTFGIVLPDVSGSTINTGSFATTGSNTFIGNETFQDAAGNASTLVPTSGSLMLVAKSYTSASSHISGTANLVNLIFKNSDATADTILSGSGNIFTNPNAPTAGFKRYIGGSNNIINTAATPLISGSMQFSPTMAQNYIVGGITLRGPVSASTYNISSNNVLGTISIGSSAALHAEKLTSGLTMTGNSIGGTLALIANQSALTGSTTSFTNNIIAGTTTLNLSSSAVAMANNIINDSGFIFTNQFYSSSLGLGSVAMNRNNIGGQSNSIIISGSLPSGTTTTNSISDNFIFGGVNTLYIDVQNARVSGSAAYINVIRTGLMGNNLIVSGSSLLSDASSYGSVFVGRYNADDNRRNKTSDTVFAVGTGNTTTRKTGFLIDSGSNTFVEGTLNVSGSTSFTGSTNFVGGDANFTDQARNINIDVDRTIIKGQKPTLISSSLDIQGSLTASLANGYVWVGDATNHNVLVATSSFATNVSNLATTGSNSFNGNQTITGSLILSSSAATELTVIGNMVVTGSANGNVVSMSITSNTASMDLNLGNYFTLTLAGTATTHISASNVQPGVSATLVITTGTNSSASLAPTMLQPSGSSYSATNGSGKKDVLSIVAVASGVPFVVSTKNMI